jgi:hypothetical protein
MAGCVPHSRDESDEPLSKTLMNRLDVHDWMERHKAITSGLVIVTLIITLLLGVRYRAQWKLAHFKEELVAGGEKLTFEELLPRLPSGSNGGPALIRAVRLFPRGFPRLGGMKQAEPGFARTVWKEKELLEKISESAQTTNGWEVVDKQMSENAESFQQIRDAIELGTLYFEVKSAFDAPIPHPAELSKASAYLTTAAIYDLHRGKQSEAMSSLIVGLAIVENFHEPIAISQMARCGIGQRQVQGTWEALQWDGWTDTELQTLQSAWQRLNIGQDVRSCGQLERVWGMQSSDRASQSYGNFMDAFNIGWTGAGKSRTSLDQLADGTKRMMLDPLGGLQEIGRVPFYWSWCWAQRYNDERALLAYWQDVRNQNDAAFKTNGFSQAIHRFETGVWSFEGVPVGVTYPITKLWSSGLSRFIKAVALFQACRELSVTAIALERFHLREKRYPSGLAELVPNYLSQVPADVFDGQPLRYVSTNGAKFLLYSVGPDGVDAQGDASAPTGTVKPSWLEGRDLVWPRPAD